MANRPNVQEILAAVRAAGPSRSERESSSDASSPSPPAEPVRTEQTSTAQDKPETDERSGSEAQTSSITPEASRPLTLQEKLAAARNRPADASKDASKPKPLPAVEGQPASGRPLSVKEKLAAARNRPAEAGQRGVATSDTAASQSGARASENASERPAASGPAVPVAADPEASGKPLSLQEKIAAARGRPATDSSQSSPKRATDAKPVAKETDRNAATALRERPPAEKRSGSHGLAESLRRAGENWRASADRTLGSGNGRVGTAAQASPAIGSAGGPELARRGFLASVGIRWALGGAALAAGIGTTGVVVARRLSSTGSRDGSGLIAVGDPSIFEPNSAVEVHESDPPIWVVRSTGYDGLDTIYALRGRCPGGGSLASWSPETRTFECPGSADRYAISGLPLTGSGKRALERYRVALADDGRLVVDSTRTFREELGQWADSESFIRLSPEGSALR